MVAWTADMPMVRGGFLVGGNKGAFLSSEVAGPLPLGSLAEAVGGLGGLNMVAYLALQWLAMSEDSESVAGERLVGLELSVSAAAACH